MTPQILPSRGAYPGSVWPSCVSSRNPWPHHILALSDNDVVKGKSEPGTVSWYGTPRGTLPKQTKAQIIGLWYSPSFHSPNLSTPYGSSCWRHSTGLSETASREVVSERARAMFGIDWEGPRQLLRNQSPQGQGPYQGLLDQCPSKLEGKKNDGLSTL